MSKTFYIVLSAALLPAVSLATKIPLNTEESAKIYKSVLNGAISEENESDHFQVFSARIEGTELACDRTYSTEKGVKSTCTMLARDRKGLRRFKIQRTNAQIITQILDHNQSIPKKYVDKSKTTSITLKSIKCDKDMNSKKFKPVCVVDLGDY